MYPAPFRQMLFRVQGMLCSCFSPRRIALHFFAWGCACLVLCFVSWQPACAATSGKNASTPQWVHMPAGARATYIGIHGGTVPVSLLTSRDGTHMVALVGQTGNDFLRTLKVNSSTREASSPLPSGTLPVLDDKQDTDLAHLYLQPSSAPAPPSFRHAANATLLMAGTAVGAMPVIYSTGHSFATLNQLYADSLLFGISEHSLLLEGTVKAPLQAAKKTKPAKRRPLVRGSSTPVN